MCRALALCFCGAVTWYQRIDARTKRSLQLFDDPWCSASTPPNFSAIIEF
jgi:hypothetical protein